MSQPDVAPPISALYLEAYESFAAFAATLSPADWATPVPCLPGWDARDVLSHVSGIPDDALAGRFDGVATEPWTASQVARNRDFTVDELLSRWSEQAAGFAAGLDAIGERRPPFDCHSHEHDIRQALDRPGNRDSTIVEAGAMTFAHGFDHPFPVTVSLTDGRTLTSGGNGAAGAAVIVRDVSTFELFRSGLGRRSRSQVENYDWVGDDDDIATVIDGWFMFGPAEQPVLE